MKQTLILLCILSANISNAQETIPFKLGDDNRIYMKGIVNQSDTLDLVFDLGANITVINKTRMKKNNVNIKFDTLVSNSGTNGSSEEEKSFNNQVVLGKQKYKNIDILGISYPEDDLMDGIIGWNFFKDKIVQINYESKELLIYDKLPELSKGYNKCKLKLVDDDGLPYVEVIVYKGKKKVKIWAMLDTGYNSELLVYFKEVKKNDLLNKFQVIGEATSYGTDGSISKQDKILLPKFSISGFEIYNMPSYLNKTEFETDIPAILGGNLLKRFHIVLDFEKKLIYLKPNININSRF
ncbi:hypothetical protein BZARG_2205 [Bizionia argentinensis JUB59]|uniref:Aspartyl protease n=1 Tax=Bizionia argentinensis JUB59 TaxID=1046627 RepID=G2EG97_9FLAO|nr:aspartyl protease family protein [Bizionia argentinensis]EGV42506.1 hypothetical protein BZARG_2205 [Bizionia argentinensis JUB59]